MEGNGCDLIILSCEDYVLSVCWNWYWFGVNENWCHQCNYVRCNIYFCPIWVTSFPWLFALLRLNTYDPLFGFNYGCSNFRYEHPLLIEGRDKSEWVLPITVHAPPSGAPAGHNRNDKHFSLEPLWVRTWRWKWFDLNYVTL